MKKKIAIIGTMPGGGISGGRLLAWYLGETLAASGFEVDFITNRTPSFYRDVKQFTRIKIKKVLIWNRISRKLKFINGRAFFPIKNYDLSIIVPQRQDFNLHINMLKIAKKHSQKTILLNFETPNWYNYVSNYQINEHEWDGWKYIGNNCDLILSISKESKKWAQLFFKKETKHNYFYTGINTIIADSVTNVTKNKKQILIISRFGTHKGLSNFNEFFNELEHGLEVVIIIGVHNKAFSTNIHELNLIAEKYGVKLTFKFNVSEFEKFKTIKESSLLVFPSSFEGFGMPPLESLYCGVPVLAFELDVLNEWSDNMIQTTEPGNYRKMGMKALEIISNIKDYESKINVDKINNIASILTPSSHLLKIFNKII